MVDVARAAGVDRSTVSLALAGSPKLPAATRARVRAVAERLGYRHDPMLQALAAYRQGRRPPAFRSKLAFVCAWPDEVSIPAFVRQCEVGAARRAARLGYRLERFVVGTDAAQQLRWARRAFQQGVQGLVVAPLPDGVHAVAWDWERFSAVRLAYTLREPELNFASPAHDWAFTEAWKHLRARGCARIGYVQHAITEDRLGDVWMGAFLKCCWRHGGGVEPPLLYGSFDGDAFRKWRRRVRPDGIVCSYGARIVEWLRDDGLRVPEDVRVAVPDRPPAPSEPPGIDQDLDLVGEAAVDLLHGMILHGERGVPAAPRGVLVRGHWVDGV
jgi:LacI family transcriptional regulator